MRQRLPALLLCLAALFVGPPAVAHADIATPLPFTNSAPIWLAVDPAGQHVFVSGGTGSSLIVVLDFAGNIVKTITGEGGASEMAVDTATHTLYVALSDAGEISEIDTTTLTEKTRFTTGQFVSPTSLVIGGGKLWFSCMDGANGCVASANLDGSGMASANLQAINGGDPATALAVGGSSHNLLAVGGSYGSPTPVAVYDVSQDPPSLVSSSNGIDLACGGNMQDMALDPSGAHLFLACASPYAVVSLATSDLSPSATYPASGYPDSVAVSADGAYVAAGSRTIANPDIAVYQAGSASPVRSWSLETQLALAAHALAFSPDASELFAVTASSNGADFHVLDQPTVPTTLSLSPSHQTILAGAQTTLTSKVTGASTGTVDLYATPEGGSKTLVSGLPVGPGDLSFAVSPAVTTTYSVVLPAGTDHTAATSPDVTVTVVPRSMPIAASKGTVKYGGETNLTLSGVSSGTVDLYATPHGQAPVLLQKADVSAKQDSITFAVSPRRNTTYLAEREDQTAASNDLTVSVRPLLAFAVHAKRVSPKVVRRRGEKVVLAAVRKPALADQPLEIEIDRRGRHGTWIVVTQGEVPVGRTGLFAGVIPFTARGRYRAMADFAGDDSYVGARSPWRYFDVG
jgi:hypothetical protein